MVGGDGDEPEEKGKDVKLLPSRHLVETSQGQKAVDPVVGRASEIRRVTHKLPAHQNNPVLIGEAGVVKLPLSKALPNKLPGTGA